MDENEAEAAEKTVDPSKYQSALRAKREAQARIAELELQMQQLQERATLAESLQSKVAELESGTLKLREEYESERGIWRAGLTDPEGIEIARLLYSRLPQESRPTMSDWLSGFAADVSTAPRALAAYFSPPAPAPGLPPAPQSSLSTAPASPGAAALPNANRGAVPGAAAPTQSFDAATIRAMREDAQRTGDYSRLREAMPAIKKACAS